MPFFKFLSLLTFLVGIISSSNKASNPNSNRSPLIGKSGNYVPNLSIKRESTANQFALLYQQHKNMIRIYENTGQIPFSTRKYLFPICKILFLNHQTCEKRWALFAEMEKFVHSEPNFISFLINLYFEDKGGDYDFKQSYLDLYSDIIIKRTDCKNKIHCGSLLRLQSLAKETPETSLSILCSIYNSILMHCEHIFRSRNLLDIFYIKRVFYDLEKCRKFGNGSLSD
jgi:hypothetical protein